MSADSLAALERGEHYAVYPASGPGAWTVLGAVAVTGASPGLLRIATAAAEALAMAMSADRRHYVIEHVTGHADRHRTKHAEWYAGRLVWRREGGHDV
jgi:hypothetical protein